MEGWRKKEGENRDRGRQKNAAAGSRAKKSQIAHAVALRKWS